MRFKSALFAKPFLKHETQISPSDRGVALFCIPFEFFALQKPRFLACLEYIKTTKKNGNVSGLSLQNVSRKFQIFRGRLTRLQIIALQTLQFFSFSVNKWLFLASITVRRQERKRLGLWELLFWFVNDSIVYPFAIALVIFGVRSNISN